MLHINIHNVLESGVVLYGAPRAGDYYRENRGKYIDLRNLWKAEVMESRTNRQKKTEGHGYVNSHSGIHRWDEELAMIGGR